MLSTKEGTLSNRLSRPLEGPPRLPKFEASVADVAAPRALPPLKLQFDQGLGGFSPDGREYVIEVSPGRPTPAPWCNVLTNPEFGCLVSESSLGMSWSQNSGENRLTPWRNDPVFDRPSEVLYLRDEETAAVWSPTRTRPATRGVATGYGDRRSESIESMASCTSSGQRVISSKRTTLPSFMPV